MKKSILLLSLAVILVLGLAASVYADSTQAATPQWFKDMITWKKDQVKQAVSAGQLTEEQAQLYYDRINQMEKYHSQNGFNGKQGFSHCGNGYGGFNGGGMMRGRF